MSQISLSPEELSDLIGLVYDSAFEEVQWQSLLTRITELFPGVGGVAYGTDGDLMIPAFARAGVSDAFFSDPTEINIEIKSGLTPPEALRLTPNGFVARSKVFFDDDVWISGPFYQDFLAEGKHHALQLKVDHNSDRSAVIAFGIPKDPVQADRLHDPLFEVLKLLSPHAIRASLLARALSLAKKTTEVFSGFLDGVILPMLVTDAQGRYLFGNAAGRKILERRDPFRQAKDGRLVLTDENATAELAHKLAQTNRNLVQSGLRVQTTDTPLMLAISPFRPSMRDASAIDKHLLDEERMFAIFVGQSEQDAMNTGLLEDVFDLTRREAEVCASLLAGESASRIAETSGRALKTVRNQIQTIYEKVGVSSNVELIDRLAVFRTVGTLFDDQSIGATNRQMTK
ncbi:MAG: helix-turn-helix transcriptional regulator [Pseudomonadota bacterium]